VHSGCNKTSKNLNRGIGKRFRAEGDGKSDKVGKIEIELGRRRGRGWISDLSMPCAGTPDGKNEINRPLERKLETTRCRGREEFEFGVGGGSERASRLLRYRLIFLYARVS